MASGATVDIGSLSNLEEVVKVHFRPQLLFSVATQGKQGVLAILLRALAYKLSH